VSLGKKYGLMKGEKTAHTQPFKRQWPRAAADSVAPMATIAVR
jgi:hypothetical protein